MIEPRSIEKVLCKSVVVSVEISIYWLAPVKISNLTN